MVREEKLLQYFGHAVASVGEKLVSEEWILVSTIFGAVRIGLDYQIIDKFFESLLL